MLAEKITPNGLDGSHIHEKTVVGEPIVVKDLVKESSEKEVPDTDLIKKSSVKDVVEELKSLKCEGLAKNGQTKEDVIIINITVKENIVGDAISKSEKSDDKEGITKKYNEEIVENFVHSMYLLKHIFILTQMI